MSSYLQGKWIYAFKSENMTTVSEAGEYTDCISGLEW